jgi:hypothetical protein
VLAAVALLLAGPALLAGSAAPGSAASGSAASGRAAKPAGWTDPVLGAYLGPGANGTARLGQWQAWSGAPARYGIDFLPADSWQTISGPGWLLSAWRGAGRKLVLSVPMLPVPPGAASPGTGSPGAASLGIGSPPGFGSPGVASLAGCGSGQNDATWRALAANLVAQRLTDTIVRPGWEFNGDWYAWSANGQQNAYTACFRRLVHVMRSVPGQHFRFLWNPAIGALSFPAEQAWPGRSYVDIIGVDLYDMSWQPQTYPVPTDATAAQRAARAEAVWQELEAGDHGLAFWVRFAARHGVDLALPEWGLVSGVDGHGGDDDPAFVRHVIDFVRQPANRVHFALYFDVDTESARHRVSTPDTAFPRAARLLSQLLRST